MPRKKRTVSPQDVRTQITREMLLDSTIDLVNREGMSALTIRNICDEIGISTGSFYNLFDGKDELIAYFLRNIFASYKQEAESLADNHSALERIILMYRFYIKCVMEAGLEFISCLYSSITNPVFNFLEREDEEEVVLGRVRQYLEEGIADGEVQPDIDINQVLLHVAVIITGNIYYWCAFEGRVDLAYQADNMLQRYLRSISTDEERSFDVAPIPHRQDVLI